MDEIPQRGRKVSISKPAFVALLSALFVAGGVFGAGIYHIGRMSGESERVPHLKGVTERSANIVAVRSQGGGIIAGLTVEVSPGDGDIFVKTKPLVGFDFQYADRTAVSAVSKVAGISLDDDGEGFENADVRFIVSATTEERIEIRAVDGPSAGAAAAIITLAAVENKEVKDNVVITGTIKKDGSIGLVGGVAAKAKAAEDAGKDLFLVPKGQYVTVYERWGLFTIRRQKPISYLRSYAENHGWNLEIREVSSIEEAADRMLG